MSREKGTKAEEVACHFLMQNGFDIRERNYFARFGEIDIIAYKDGVLHFIEVKSGDGFEPIYNITPSKIAKLTQAIGFYLLENAITDAYCLDALVIKDGKCELIENITL